MTPTEYQVLQSKITVYKILQKLRKGVQNRIWAYEHKDQYRKKRGLPPIALLSDDREYLDAIFGDVRIQLEGLEGKEREVAKTFSPLAFNHPIWIDWLKNVSGIGPVYTAILIVEILPRSFLHRSSLTKFCGYHTINGRKARKVAGRKLDYDPFLQSVFWNIGENFTKSGDEEQYYGYYLREKEFYTKKYPEYLPPPKGWKSLPKEEQHPKHLHKLAINKTVKLFMSHLWDVKYKMENLGKVPLPRHYGSNAPLSYDEVIAPYGYSLSKDLLYNWSEPT